MALTPIAAHVVVGNMIERSTPTHSRIRKPENSLMRIVAGIAVVLGLLLGLKIVEPAWQEFKATQRDCVQAKTPGQQERCAPPKGRPAGWLFIPGLW